MGRMPWLRAGISPKSPRVNVDALLWLQGEGPIRNEIIRLLYNYYTVDKEKGINRLVNPLNSFWSGKRDSNP